LPPPPPAEAVNPPPPPAIARKAEPAMGEGGLDNDMIMTLAGVGIVALGAFALIISRKRRQSRDAAVAFNDTQVGT
jgi:LPXTG-motif cell wall-anchored protein